MDLPGYRTLPMPGLAGTGSHIAIGSGICPADGQKKQQSRRLHLHNRFREINLRAGVGGCVARFWTFATVEIKGVPFIAITQNMNFVVFVSDFDPPRVLSDQQRRTQSTGGEGGDSDPSSSV